MKRTLTINGAEHVLELTPGEVLSCQFDGVPFDADSVEISPGLYSILIGGQQFCARVSTASDHKHAVGNGSRYTVEAGGDNYSVEIKDPRRWSRSRGGIAHDGRQQITAPMSGKVVSIMVAEGQQVKAGKGVIVVEAMKMQNEIKSAVTGIVTKLSVAEGQAVNTGETLLTIE